QIMTADPRDPVPLPGGAVNGDELADSIALADLYARRFAAVFQILGSKSDRRVREDAVSPAQPRVPVEHRVGHHLAVLSQLDVFPDQGIRSHRHAAGELGVGMDDGCGMSLHWPD